MEKVAETLGIEAKRTGGRVVDCSGLENRNTVPPQTAQMAGLCGLEAAQHATFADCSDTRDGALVGTPNPDRQRHYAELAFLRSGDVELLADHTDSELAIGFQLFAQECGLPRNLPVPPKGLPGHNDSPDEEVMDIIREGVRYAIALAKGERKTLWNIHDKIASRLHAERTAAREALERETSARLTAELKAHMDNRTRLATASAVYFIQSATGDIKIGMAVNVGARLKGLQTAHPVKLTLLASCTGGARQERAYHKQFAEFRKSGEWFAPHPDILAEVARLTEASA